MENKDKSFALAIAINDWVDAIDSGDVGVEDICDEDFVNYLKFMASKADEDMAEEINSYVDALESEGLWVGDVGADNFVWWARRTVM